MPAKPFPV
jgi:hypothetical protein